MAEAQIPGTSKQTEEDFSDFVRIPRPGDEAPEVVRIKQLLELYANHTYSSLNRDSQVEIVLWRCTHLLEKDYNILLINNEDGRLTQTYPDFIPFINSEKNGSSEESQFEIDELNNLITKGNRARCLRRFPVPVILYNGKSVCRSATLAVGAEIFGRAALDYLYSFNPPPNDQREGEVETPPSSVDDVQEADIAVLQKYKVGTIIDLMVEAKKYKYGLPMTSSEKDESQVKYHSLFNIFSMPYPGCEFFKKFHNNDFNPEGLMFDWGQAMCDAKLSIGPELNGLDINWEEYKSWDLVNITKNYIKYILKYLQGSESGVLVHCVSGWDRTPLFISIIRMSLWADGLIHKNLTVEEMLYFTLGYDWMLFGHDLNDRLKKNEDIFLFCFSFLRYIIDDSFSLDPKKKEFQFSCDPCSSSETFNPPPVDVFPIYAGPPDLQIKFSDSDEDVTIESKTFEASSHSSLDVNLGPTTSTSVDSVQSGCSQFVDEGSSSPSELGASASATSFQSDISDILPKTSAMNISDESSTSTAQEGHMPTDRASSSSIHPDLLLSRGAKLASIRRLFYKCYYGTLNHQQYGGGLLVNILNNLTTLAHALNPLK